MLELTNVLTEVVVVVRVKEAAVPWMVEELVVEDPCAIITVCGP